MKKRHRPNSHRKLNQLRLARLETLEDRRLLAFAHPSIVSTQADYDRMVAKVAAVAQPWTAGYNALTSDGYSQPDTAPRPLQTVLRGGTGQNFNQMVIDMQRTYQLAVRWKVSGNVAYANQAVIFLNAWSSTMTTLGGNSDRFLASGLYGYGWAAAADIMRSYSGWATADVTSFQNYLLNIYYPMQHDFLVNHNTAYITNYWANWDLANVEGMMAVGIFTDRQDLYDEAINYLKTGGGNGALDKIVYYMHPGNLGQWQESGRDQGHSVLGMQLFGHIAQMAWQQGDDLFSYNNYQFLAAAEYVAKYNLGNEVPFETYNWGNGQAGTFSSQTVVSGSGRGDLDVGYERIVAHYVGLLGMAMPYSQQRIALRGTEYRGSGDDFGFGTLIFPVVPVTTGLVPSVTAKEKGAAAIELDWYGTSNATGYNIYRATSLNGTYTQIASNVTGLLTYLDFNLPAGTYDYKIRGITTSGETGDSNVVSATATSLLQTQLLFNEASGTTANDASGNGHNGMLNGGATFAAGHTGNAISLNGSTSYVSLPNGLATDVSDFTISSWVFLNSVGTWSRIFDFGDNRGRWMYLTPKNGNGVVEFATSTVYGYNKQWVTGTAALPANQWVHVTVTLANHVGTIYVNGVAVGSNSHLDFPPMQIGSTPNNWIGRSQFSSDPYLNGKIDDFQISRGAMSAGQIYTLATGADAPAVPAAPASLTALAQIGNTNNLNWASVAGATSYSIWRSTSATGPYTALATLYNGTSYSDTGLTAGTAYYYVVTAVNNGGESVYTPQVSATALPPLPTSPTGLTAKAVSASSVSLTWTAGANATSHTVRRALTSGGPYATLATGVTATTFADTGLTNGVRYYYVVSTVNAAGESANSSEDSAVPSSLILLYKFDDGSGTNVQDLGTNVLHGTLVNGPVWTTAGKMNSAVVLDGVNDYVAIPSGVLSGVTTATISTWFNTNVLATWQRLFDFGTGTTNFMMLTAQGPTANRLRFSIITPTVAGQDINSSVATPLGWNHVAVVLNGSTGSIYLNGVLVGTNTEMTLNPSSLGTTTQNWIGRSQFTADPYYNGRIDDFRIYSRVLSATEISSLALTSPPATPSGLTASVVNNSEVDLTWTPISGIAGYSIRRAPTAAGPWTTLFTGRQLANYADQNLTPAYYFYQVAAENALGNSTYTAAVPVTILPDPPGSPTNFAVLPASLTSNYLSWAVDPLAWSQTISRATNPAGPFTTVAAGFTGSTYTDASLTSGTTYYYKVTSVNAAGTADSETVSSAPSNLIEYLRLDDGTGIAAEDATGHGLVGTLQTGASWSTTGKIGGAVSLNGSNGFVALPSGIVGALSAVTISSWVNLNALANWSRIFDFGTGTTNYMFLTPTNGSAVRFAIRTPSVAEQVIAGTSALPTGVWTHVAVTLSGTVGTLYVNGVQVAQNAAMTLNPTSLGVTTQNYLGKSQFTSDPYLNGKIDDFKIFNRALTSTEVASLALAAPLSVTNTNDAGTGSLRQALLDANSGISGNGTINFSAATGTQNLQLTSQLPDLLYPTNFSIPTGSSYGIGITSTSTLANFPSLTLTGGGSLALGGSQTRVAPATLTISSGSLALASDLGANVSLVSSGAVTISSSQHLAGLTLSAGATGSLTGNGKVLVTNALSMNTTASLDLAGNSLIVHSTDSAANSIASAVNSWLATGIGTAGSYWNGNGIRSSTAAADAGHLTALGMLSNGYANGTRMSTFAGEAVGASDVLVKYTYYGDADLSGVVTGGDYAGTDNGFNFGLSGWTNGDFNYDGMINAADYALLDNAFNSQGGPLQGSPLQPLALTLPATTNTQAIDQAVSALFAVSPGSENPTGLKKQRALN
jgi:fibronectin type 3 domain-containing protein